MIKSYKKYENPEMVEFDRMCQEVKFQSLKNNNLQKIKTCTGIIYFYKGFEIYKVPQQTVPWFVEGSFNGKTVSGYYDTFKLAKAYVDEVIEEGLVEFFDEDY